MSGNGKGKGKGPPGGSKPGKRKSKVKAAKAKRKPAGPGAPKRGAAEPGRPGRKAAPRTAARSREAEPAAAGDLLVCRLEHRGRQLSAVPFFNRGPRIPVDRVRDGGDGDLVLLQTARSERGAPKVLRVLGRPDNAAAVLEALMLDRGLARRFPPGVEKAAEEARDAGRAGQLDHIGGAAREDLRALTTFTIDPATAKDFDDAISAEALGDGHWRVWVHIADVSAFVRPGSAIDREAYRRATSVYVPGKVEPMLPVALSNDACSLRPGVDRLAVTAELEVRGDRVVSARFCRSTIRSDERLDYDRVDRIFAGEERAEDPWAGPLAAARAAAAALGSRRAAGALSIESAEPTFSFDGRGHVDGAKVGIQTESHTLIEHLMVATNEAVAGLLDERKIPTLYRVHEKPDGSAVERLVEQLASLDVATPAVPERLTPDVAAQAIVEASRLIDEHATRTGHGRRALTSLLLRSLKQARYGAKNLGHAGLGLSHYCHFTSPIRRYPDLVAHRALLSAIGAGEDAPRGGAMEEAGVTTSAREREAMKIERAADDVARCFLLERELFEGTGGTGRPFPGEVVGIIEAGAFVAFGGPDSRAPGGYEGMLPVRRMHGDWWTLNEAGTVLTGTSSKESIRLGDAVTVSVHRVDAPRGRVDLDLS
ncbi:RNB domain-containing ribonuclease [Paraconexibacter antarcticus]|uniref:RNB domain-containing ribonuclease n=1 Tax=Paraconexibacter antarcticus TaxID=2949664 RepID=A0ABY5DZ83_9ACTN|nr:RNB domain-containing ribonuclease [Paraconexibacter antarcticus]UTI65874.1 RNB domain-containing ribonuclease [Paraconexibacter antarcticus]